jgi:DNA helicase-2/ATP-dependent DNA helicase PcrA
MRLARGSLISNDTKERDTSMPKAGQLVEWLSYARNTNVPVRQYLAANELLLPEQLELVMQVYERYEARKKQARYLDFDDILYRCALHLTTNKALRERIAGRFSHVLVDEVQDTSTLQWQLLHALRQHAELFCVGDDAQSIYAFRGANFATVHDFATLVKGGTVYRLTENYRSTQPILDISNWLLAVSPLKYDKQLTAARGGGGKPLLVECDDEFAQGVWIANDLQRRHGNGLAWANMTVLVRTAWAARQVETACIERNIPYVFVGGTSLLKAAHVRDVLSLLRVRINLRDDVAWMRYLTLWKGVGDRTAERYVQQINACDSLEQAAEYMYRTKPGTDGPAMPLMHLLQSDETPAAQMLAAGQALEGLLRVKYQFEHWEQRRKDIDLLVRVAGRFRSLAAFVEEFLLDPLHASQVTPPGDAVIISTVHAAKGSESDIVYLARADAGQYPHSRAQSEADIEEERRVLYVALTRAKDELILVRSPEYIAQWGANNCFFDTLPAPLVVLAEHGQRRRELWLGKSSLDAVIPPLEE